ncbi:hypothetical protein PTE30175_02446 [Pandoraea terrae]|uniref:Transcriptional initiation protein Tat n=1 Tax=Pandoraea terrae TaxID=1537710 RepID=A0A5E4VAX6_9BURK|nr:transcriptional initiation protein Tat [Pandoraea terrae]VVE08724.1 hypothetical protein PTE30175_02446 [Pandoraea terrae]
MAIKEDRRAALRTFGVAAGAAILSVSGQSEAKSADAASLLPNGAGSLRQLMHRLAAAPRRRDLKTVPMILQSPDQWDHEALTEVLTYRSSRRQVWDNVDIGGPWLNLMRNSLNAQIWSFKHPEFLVVSSTHGTANLALLDQAIWDKYGIAKLTSGKFQTNTLLLETPSGAMDPHDYENNEGAFSSRDNSIAALLRRGVVFISCHNALWELAEKLIASGNNPDKLPVTALAAELTNHVIPEAIVVPGAVATQLELQSVGFQYSK